MNVDINKMVDNFLSWKLPIDFYPDCGISFKNDFNEHTQWPSKHNPIGTNLFSAGQAKEMIEAMLVGAVDDQAATIAHLQLENAKFRDVLEFYKCFSDSRISSIAQTALLNITTAEEVTHNKPDERKEFEDWLEDFKAQHEEWQYADSEAMYFAAWQARANLSM